MLCWRKNHCWRSVWKLILGRLKDARVHWCWYYLIDFCRNLRRRHSPNVNGWFLTFWGVCWLFWRSGKHCSFRSTAADVVLSPWCRWCFSVCIGAVQKWRHPSFWNFYWNYLCFIEWLIRKYLFTHSTGTQNCASWRLNLLGCWRWYFTRHHKLEECIFTSC